MGRMIDSMALTPVGAIVLFKVRFIRRVGEHPAYSIRRKNQMTATYETAARVSSQ
jgi:hypothetical protein